jgi:hypothetical protein
VARLSVENVPLTPALSPAGESMLSGKLTAGARENQFPEFGFTTLAPAAHGLGDLAASK